MNRKTKGWLIAAVLLVIVGLAICVGTMLYLDWDLSKLGTEKYQTNVYGTDEKFDDIAISTHTSDITFELAEDGKCRVVCYETEKMYHSVLVKDNTLEITLVDSRELNDCIGIAVGTPEIRVCLPRAAYERLYIKGTTGDIYIPEDFRLESIEIRTTTGDVECYASGEKNLKIETGTGYIHAENISTAAMELAVTTGDITLRNIDCGGALKIKVTTGRTDIRGARCESLATEGSTGDIGLSDVVASGSFSIERTTGAVSFDSCDAAEIFVRTDTGDVSGSLLSGKIFVIETNTGAVDVPYAADGGKCEIITSTGDVEITEKRK